MLEPTVCVRELELSFWGPVMGPELERRGAELLQGLADDLQRAGCTLIGHLKCLIETGDMEPLFLSVTRFGQTPRARGAVPQFATAARLSVNAIVFGVPREEVEVLLDAGIAGQFGTSARQAGARP